MQRLLSSISTITLSALLATPAIAQDTSVEPDQVIEEDEQGGSALFNEILVTAQKKSKAEAAQDVPVAISAFNTATIQSTLSENLRDLAFYAPNVSLLPNATSVGVASFSIRGLGSAESTESVEPTVGLVKDGLVYAQRYGSFIETFDLESVEILRGPQGTLFGRNVTAGAVNVRSRRPQLDPGLRGQVRSVVGTEDRFDIMGYVDATIIPDEMGIIVSAARLKQDGPVKNINPIGGTLGDKDVVNVRGALLMQPTPGFDVQFTIEHNHDTSDSTLAVDPTYVTDFFEANRDDDNQIDLKATTYILESNIDVPGGVLTAIAGYRETDYGDNGVQEVDGTPNPAFGFRQQLDHKQSSLEIRYATDGLFENLDFTVGAFYMDQNLDLVAARYQGPPLVSSQRIQGYGARQDSKSWAIFGQAEYRLSDELSIAVGGRYTDEKKTFDLAPRRTGGCGSAPFFGTDTLPDISDCVFIGETSASWNDFSPMARLTFRPRDGLMTYASYSKGFRSGGFNSRATSSGLGADGLPVPYDDESLTNYEIGFKSDWLDNRLRLNGAVFFAELGGLQRNVTGPAPAFSQTILNAGRAEMFGIEFDVTAMLAEDAITQGDTLALTGNYGYIDADYTFFDTNSDGVSDADQLKFAKTPPHTFSVSLLYDTPIGDAGDLGFRIAYRFEDQTFPDTENLRPILPSIKELDASISFTNADDWLTLRAFVKNATNHKALYQILPVLNDVIYPRPGRHIGLEAIVKF